MKRLKFEHAFPTKTHYPTLLCRSFLLLLTSNTISRRASCALASAASVNYHHVGAPKVWYGVAGAQAARFQAACRLLLPLLSADAPDLLLRIVTMISPLALARAAEELDRKADTKADAKAAAGGGGGGGGHYGTGRGLTVVRAVQRPGCFVVTFPAAYHAGFNSGFNVAEAVNFAAPDWLPWVRASHTRTPRSTRAKAPCSDTLYTT